MEDVPANAVVPYGCSKSRCGYCKNPLGNTSCTYGFSAKSYAPEDYDTLMLHGWSRSGDYIYCPINNKTCCPQYIIRLHTMDFAPSSSQRKTWRRFKKLLTASANEPSKISISMERATFTEEKFALYKKYTTAIHKDKDEDIKESTFQGFLVDSPMNVWLKSQHGDQIDNCKYGTFHQLYRIPTGELIAVGVQDILPSGMISVYFYYDPDYKHLSLGRCSALYEIDYCREHGYEFYYMGYYVHNCSKMNYKRDYSPSDMLCPSSYTWVPVPNVLPLLETFAFTPFIEPLVSIRAIIEEEVCEGNGEEQIDEYAYLQSLKEEILESLISVGSNKEKLFGVDCSYFEAWEVRSDPELIHSILYYQLPLIIKGWSSNCPDADDSTEVIEIVFDKFRQYYPARAQEFVYGVIKDILRFVGKDLAVKYPVYFR